MKQQYYNLTKIMKKKALYNIIIGQRANGKTYSVIALMLKKFITQGIPSAYIRRLDSELIPSTLFTLLKPHIDDIKKISKGIYNDYLYKARVFYLVYRNDNGDIEKISEPCIYCYALSISKNAKGADRGEIAYTLFDEFLTRKFYLNNEFIIYTELLSTIIRNRDNVINFLVGNTVNKYCPYFAEMGLNHITEQKQGTIDVYKYSNSDLTVAVEYCAENDVSKISSKYFSFDNPQLNMITRGMWELANYPHCMERITKNDIIAKCFVIFDNNTLCINLVKTSTAYLLVTPQTHSIPDKHIIYSDTATNNPYIINDITRDNKKISRLIYGLIVQNRVFFSDNNTGEIFNNWLKYSRKKIWKD